MTILVSADGRRCDEACYNAKRLGCHCICGGRNHGLGLEHALANQREYQEAINQSASGEMDDIHAHEDDDIEDDDTEDDDL